MPDLDLARSRDLLVRIVQHHYTQRHTPLPGAFVKVQMLAEAQRDGADFNERTLGFRKFIDFVRTVPQIAIQVRSGSDILLAPETATEILAAYATALPRLRRDFWRAFIEFPVANTIRLYDPEEDKILIENTGESRPGIVIEPIPRDTQLQWRRTFAEEQPEGVRADLLATLDVSGNTAFNEFSRRLRENPSVMRAWNRYLQKQIIDSVGAWAKAHGVPDERWLASRRQFQIFSADGQIPSTRKAQTISQRAELYNLLEQLPIEDLLQLRVPLEFVLKLIRRGEA